MYELYKLTDDEIAIVEADRESALDARRRCRIFRRAAFTVLGLPT